MYARGWGGGGQIDIDPIYKFDKPTGRNKEQLTHALAAKMFGLTGNFTK